MILRLLRWYVRWVIAWMGVAYLVILTHQKARSPKESHQQRIMLKAERAAYVIGAAAMGIPFLAFAAAWAGLKKNDLARTVFFLMVAISWYQFDCASFGLKVEETRGRWWQLSVLDWLAPDWKMRALWWWWPL